MLTVTSNLAALSARNSLNRTHASLKDIFKSLTTGRRINSGKDDPAGLIASERLMSEIKSIEAENRALQRADANARIAEGHASELSTLYNDLNGLVVASANQAGMSDAEISANQTQIDSTVASIRRFHGDAVKSLDGISMPDNGNAEVVAQYDQAFAAAVSVQSGGANDLSSGNFEAAQTALSAASLNVATARGQIGSFQKYTVEPTIRSNTVAIENLTASHSRITDTDYALEMSNLNQAQVLTASGSKVLKIAQQQARSIMDLFS